MTLQRAVEVDPSILAEQYLHIATILPLKHWWHFPAFLGMSSQVERQLRSTPGAVRYGLRAAPLSKHFWTYTVWADQAAVVAFTKVEPHATAITRFVEWGSEGSGFAEWTSADARMNWAEALERLKQPTFTYKPPPERR